MRIGRSDVVTLFEAWRTDRAIIRCEIHLATVAATFTALVSRVSEDRVWLMSEDKWTEMVFPLRPEIVFAFGDMRGFPREAESFEGCIVAIFPYDPSVETDDIDKIVFAEVKPEARAKTNAES